MNIVEAPNIVKYSDPTHWIRTRILPIKIKCSNCESVLVFDAESDLYVSAQGTVGFTCMVCNGKQHFPKPSKETVEKKRRELAWSKMTDEEYQKMRSEALHERHTLERRYFEYGYDSSLRDKTFNEWNTVEHRERCRRAGMPFPTYQEYVEERYLPSVPPESKPENVNLILLHYDDILSYYRKQTPIVVPSNWKDIVGSIMIMAWTLLAIWTLWP